MLNRSLNGQRWRACMLVIGLFMLPGLVLSAKDWKGAVPGKTSKKEVLTLFGKATREFSKGGSLSDGLSFKGKQAIEGASEADFFFDKHSVLSRIDVFPAREVTQAEIIDIFGKKYGERVTKSGNVYFDYRHEGMVVFFQKDSTKVLSFTFLPEEQSELKEKGAE
jgi:hypothetical protein